MDESGTVSSPTAATGLTHALIDRYRLARYVCWAKNFLAPKMWRYSWGACSATGYHENKPSWLAVWLMIIADNAIHIAINGVALTL